MNPKTIAILLLALGGCASKPYHQLHDIGPAQARSLDVAQAECQMQSLAFRTSPKYGESDEDGPFTQAGADLAVAIQARRIHKLCMRTKGWQQ